VTLRPRLAACLLTMFWCFQAACSSAEAQGQSGSSGEKVITTDSGLKYIDQKEGSGEAAKAGDKVHVHCTGWLKDGKKFYSTRDRGQPYQFQLGAGRVIKGWDEGIAGLKVGGRRKLMIPPALAYGNQRMGPIPPNSELIFEVELVKIGK
jgi:peptidylprolyl isomerase